jgi:hypothetical protein
MLGDENIAFDLVAEECLAEELSSGRYRLLVLIDSHVTGDTARVIRAWVEKGGKLLLMPGAGRFDEAGAERGHFDDLVRHHNVLSLLYRDFRGWEGDGAFPEGAKAILVESASGLQIPHLLQWAGAKRALEFVDDSPPPRLEVGAGQEKIPTGNPYQRRISVYPLVDATGSDVFVLVQRGTDTEPIAGVRVVWNGGPVQAWLPPSSRPIRLVPVKGELILPSWRDVLIIAASRSGRVAAGQAGRRPRRPPGRARARRG